MIDREKVINALQQCVGYEDVDNKYTCIYDGDTNPNCPYGGTGEDGVSCMTKMMRDALALLKAQEPRVMTWQEIVDTAPQMPFIWLESKENNDRVFQSILFKTWLLDSIATIITVMTQGWLFEGYHVDYGKTWRCWTSRPTDEQRQAVKWE